MDYRDKWNENQNYGNEYRDYPNNMAPKVPDRYEQLTLWPTQDTGNRYEKDRPVTTDRAALRDAERWRQVAQVWADCQRMNDHYDEVCEALYSVVESIVNDTGEDTGGD